jgi:DNA ligase-associated metallophosphoesterase
MAQYLLHRLLHQHLLLSTERCIFWEEEKILLLSDLHFGKTGHFRKEGIAVPQDVYKEDLQRLVAQIQFFNPKQLIIIGDMFHSQDNKELDFFKKWRNDFAQLPMQLIRGNHDILKESWYSDAQIELIENSLTIGPFSFTHDIADVSKEDSQQTYFFSGHIHPGVSVRGAGRQSLRFPCFYFAGKYAVLPAFSKFTGCHPIKPKRGESVYAVLPANASANESGSIIQL